MISKQYDEMRQTRNSAFRSGLTHSNHTCPQFADSADPVEVAASLPILAALSTHLRDTASDLQNSVLEISSGFGGMADRVRETVNIAQSSLTSNGGGGTGSTISEIRHVLDSLLSAVQESTQLSSRLAGRIEKLESVLANVNTSLRRVEKISEEARIVGLNGRLEAARAGNHGAAFNVVANETKNLGIHAAETSASIRGLVDQLDTSLRSVSSELQERINIDAETAQRCELTVSSLLDQLGTMHAGMTDSLYRTESLGESLSRDIGRSVMALQFQDRVNQRLDHVVEALMALQENLSPFADEAEPDLVESRAQDWSDWLSSRSTMESERSIIGSNGSVSDSGGNSDFGSVELF